MKVFIATAAGLLLAAPALAEEQMSVEPGQWLTTTKVTMPMMAEPQVHEESSCIKPEEAKLDAETIMAEIAECTVDSVEQSSTAVSFTMSCMMEGGIAMTGQGQFETDDTRRTMSGSMVMNGDIPGVDMPFQMTAEIASERTGDCES